MFVNGKPTGVKRTGLRCDAEGCACIFWPSVGVAELRAPARGWRVDPHAPEGWQHFCPDHAAAADRVMGGPV